MPLEPGTRLGPYEITAAIGAGGMGQVYRAQDTTLDRNVAIKVLPEDVAADPDRLARFEREARSLAALNHPNIAQVFGFERHGDMRAIAMELVDGEDLSRRVARGAMPVDEAIAIARQVAAALEAAHERGIVHRDLKPANIMVREDGTVKVLDFGLAKAMDAGPSDAGTAGPSDRRTLAPTVTSPALTAMGLILGTAAYMAPEQARGRAVDKRADIWAFGCVLYEMLTGQRLFAGEDITVTLAAVVRDQPDLSRVPAGLRRLLRKCLEKDPARRLRDIGDAWDLVDDGAPLLDTPADAPASSRLAWMLAAVGIVAAAGLAIMHFGEAPPASVTSRFEVPWPAVESGATGSSAFVEVSPDGRFLAIVAENAIWVRALDEPNPVRLNGTEGATYPFWSPDSTSVAFFAGGQLRVVPRAGGVVRDICEAPRARGGAWSPRGTIVFSANSGEQGLSQVAEGGGVPTAATTLTTQSSNDAHRYPQFLPDGRRFLYLFLTGPAETAGVYVGSLDGALPVRLLDGLDRARFAASPGSASAGHLLFRRNATLMAQAFDSSSLTLSGPAIAVASDVGQGENTGYGAFSVEGGLLVHNGSGNTNKEIVWIDRSGERREVVTKAQQMGDFSAAPDERRIAISGGLQEASRATDIWLQVLGAEAPSRFTFGPPPGWLFPVWSPAGNEIAYATIDLAGLAHYEIRRKPANMAGVDEQLLQSDSTVWLWDWSPDGKTLVYTSQKDSDLWLLPVEGDRTPVRFAQTPGVDHYAQFSPDGKWMAYSSIARGLSEVFVQPVPGTGALWQVSRGGGTMPRWRRDGKELYYRSGDGQLIAVSVSVQAGAFESGGAPEALFMVPSSGNTERYTYQPSADGRRFLVSIPLASTAPPINVVLNWQAGIAK